MTSTIVSEDVVRTPVSAARTPELLDINPVTRVGGGLRVWAEFDGDAITDAQVAGTMFRGYETVLVGRDPRDVLHLSSRSCGWCGGVNMTTASLALEMAWGLQPPPMALALRTIAQATEAIWVSASHLAVRAGPDWCAGVVQQTSPWLWDAARRTEAPSGAIHGYATIADIMEALTPVTGRYWWETIPAGRRVLEMISLVYGKYPHPSVLEPGSVGSTLTIGNFTEYFTRLYRSVDYVKQVVGLWDDLLDFLADADPRLAAQGERPANFIAAGAYDDVDAYDGSFALLDRYGRRRLAAPGVVLGGQVVTGSLREVNAGIEEFVDHAFYAPWAPGSGRDPEGNAVAPNHPAGKTTIPDPRAVDRGGAYSWATAPRWNGHVVESTPLGRLWLTALRDDLPPNDYIEATGSSVRILVPQNHLPEMVVEWHIPERVNTLERLRAHAYNVAFSGLCAAIALLKGFELTRTGQTRMSVPFEVAQDERAGIGLWESGDGMTAHWLSTSKGRIGNYQILGSGTWNASPRDAFGRPGALEEALVGSPTVEEVGASYRKGIDVLRIVHGFNPCMTCGVH